MVIISGGSDMKSPSKSNSILVLQNIDAPISIVWSIVRRFDKPHIYKPYAKSCSLISGDGDIGSLREIIIRTGFPATTSIERLDVLDDNLYVMCFSIVGGDIGLSLHSTLLLQEKLEEPDKTIALESWRCSALPGTTIEDTCSYMNQVSELNLKKLALVAERINKHQPLVHDDCERNQSSNLVPLTENHIKQQSESKSVCVLQHIDAPVSLVWSIVRQFDKPQVFKPFAKKCSIVIGDGDVGSVREIDIHTGFPATSSMERLDQLEDDLHVLCYTVVGGDIGIKLHSTLLLLVDSDEPDKTIAAESFKGGTFPGTTEEETRCIIDQITKLNLRTLASVAEKMKKYRHLRSEEIMTNQDAREAKALEEEERPRKRLLSKETRLEITPEVRAYLLEAS